MSDKVQPLWTPDRQRAQLQIHYVAGVDKRGQVHAMCSEDRTPRYMDPLAAGFTTVKEKTTCPACCRRLQFDETPDLSPDGKSIISPCQEDL